MKITRTGLAVTALALVIAAAGSTYFITRKPAPIYVPDLADTLAVPKVPRQVHLYTGRLRPDGKEPLDARSKSVDIMTDDYVSPKETFLTKKDRSVVHTRLADDGKTLAGEEFFYPPLPGEIFNRLKSAITYGADGRTVKEQSDYRKDGTASSVMSTLAQDNRQTVTFHPDGASIISLIVTNKLGTTKLREEYYASVEKGNYLERVIVLNDDRSKTTTWYDGERNVLKIKQKSPHWDEDGTTVEAFFPGTKKTRLKSITDSKVTTATFYRLDGSLESKQLLTSRYIDVEFYEADGNTIRYKQHLESYFKGGDQKFRVEKAEDKLADGSKREVICSVGSLDKVRRYNFTLDGVEYSEGTWYYRQWGPPAEIGTLRQRSLKPKDGSSFFDLKDYTAADNIRQDFPDHLLQVPDLSDDLPKPSVNYGYGWYGQ